MSDCQGSDGKTYAGTSCRPHYAGSERYHNDAVAKGLQPGPRTPDEFANWPHDILHAVTRQQSGEATDDAARARTSRLLAILQRGIVLHTDYSGKRCPETCFRAAPGSDRPMSSILAVARPLGIWLPIALPS